MSGFRTLVVAPLLVAAMALPLHADNLSDLQFEMKEGHGPHYKALIITRLHTFKLGDKCWPKVLDRKEGRAIHHASFLAANIQTFAKDVTGDDWAEIEGQSGDAAKNQKLIEPMIDAFKSRFSMSITVDGDDCDVGLNAMWLRYWSTIVKAVHDYVPASQKKVVIDLVVTSKTKDVKVTTSKDGSTFTFNLPKDIEVADWTATVEKPFRKLAEAATGSNKPVR